MKRSGGALSSSRQAPECISRDTMQPPGTASLAPSPGQSRLMRPAQRVFVRRVVCDPGPRLPCKSRGPESYWIPAYAGKTLKNAVPSCADRPAGFLCNPCLRHPCESRGPEAYWIPACAGKTLKNAVSSCADRPAGFLCDPCLRHPCANRGPDPVRLHNNARGIRRQACRIPV